MTSHIPQAIRRQVRERAEGRCEYCRIDERVTIKRHHVDHVTAEKHFGATNVDNLCLACVDCNLHKGTDLASTDPLNEERTFIFHPRIDVWEEHFRLRGASIEGLTPVGRATARLLQFNDPEQVRSRGRLIRLGLYQ
jgi:hypothetical protein